MVRQDFRSFFVSALVHAGLFLMLGWMGARSLAVPPLAVEFVVLNPGLANTKTGKSQAQDVNANASKTLVTRQRKTATNFESANIQVAKKIEAQTHVMGQEEQSPSIGQTDLRSEAVGRMPQNSTEAYLAHLRHLIAHQQVYPMASRSLGEEGTAVVRLTLHRDGTIHKVELLESSSHRRLDDAAVKAAAGAGPFGAFPSEIAFTLWQITVPIRFTLTAT
jgi:TonB family protein